MYPLGVNGTLGKDYRAKLPIIFHFSKSPVIDDTVLFKTTSQHLMSMNAELIFKYNVISLMSNVDQVAGTKPVFTNHGLNVSDANYKFPIEYTRLERGHSNDIFNRGPSENLSRLREEYNANTNPLKDEFSYISFTSGEEYRPVASPKNITYKDLNKYRTERNKFIYQWYFPKRYKLKGFKFHDIVHEHKIDTVKIETPRGIKEFDRFTIRLDFPYANSKVEITKEPTKYSFENTKVKITTRRGWATSGTSTWAPGPIANGADIEGTFPYGVELIRCGVTMSRNTASDKWLGYGFYFKWPHGKRMGVRITRKPTNNFFGYNYPDPDMRLHQEDIFHENVSAEKSDLYVQIRDYTPEVVALASRWRDAKNRWHHEVVPCEFEFEFYKR